MIKKVLRVSSEKEDDDSFALLMTVSHNNEIAFRPINEKLISTICIF